MNKNIAARTFGQDEVYFTVREILAEASTVRPEPFGSETCRRDLSTSSGRVAHVESLKAELLTAEGSRPAKGGTIVRA
jgi:hypothetical protein